MISLVSSVDMRANSDVISTAKFPLAYALPKPAASLKPPKNVRYCISKPPLLHARMDPIPAAICTGAIAWTLFSIAACCKWGLKFTWKT